MSDPSDDELWARAGAGDVEAFGILFDRHSTTVYNYCFRRIGDWALAEDLTSIVFLETWRRRDSLPDGKTLPWLYGVATNVVRNARRSLRRYDSALRRLPARGAETDFAEDAAGRLDAERDMRVALGLLASLPRREQDIFVLCTWQGLSYEDAALALGIPVGTVRSRLSRARARLRELSSTGGHEEDGINILRNPVSRE
ncbi:MAG: RNA polymerase sigma factor [Gaiellaceae bacterium]